MDALAEIVTLLKPRAILSKTVRGGGQWAVRYPAFEQPSFALVLEGACRLTIDGDPTTQLSAGEFVLFPATPGFTLASETDAAAPPTSAVASGHEVDEVVHGDAAAGPSVRLLGGWFAFDPVNAPLLVDLLPRFIHVRATDPAIDGVATVVDLIQREVALHRPGRTLILTRLVEILLVETIRSSPAEPAMPGLMAGLRDGKLADVLRIIHAEANRPWSLTALAREAGMSRSSFAERFARVVGQTPLNYLLRWRMAMAKDMLARRGWSVAETARAVGYQSASAFSTAFSREVGTPPRNFIGLEARDSGAPTPAGSRPP